MRKLITGVLLIFIFLSPIHTKAEEVQAIRNYNEVEELQGNTTVIYKSNKVINIDKGDKPNDNSSNIGSVPNTGDRSMIFIWIMTAVYSMLAILILLFWGKKNNYKKECV